MNSSGKNNAFFHNLTLYQAGLSNFWQGGFLARVRKTAIKAVYFTQITWNLVQLIFRLQQKFLHFHEISIIFNDGIIQR